MNELIEPDKNKYPLAHGMYELGLEHMKLINKLDEWDRMWNMTERYRVEAMMFKLGFERNPTWTGRDSESQSKYIIP